MENVNIALFLSASFFVIGCAGPQARFVKISREVSAAGRKHDEAAISKLSSSIKVEDLSPERIGKYSDEAINALYDALLKISFYLPDEEDCVLRMESVFSEKARRRKCGGDDVERMFDAFVMSGLFNKAGALRQRFPDKSLPEVPEIVGRDNSGSTGWHVYRISEHGKKAELQSLPENGQAIIMVMRPGCEFSEMAAEEIFADQELGPIFRAKGVMLTRKFDPAGVEAIKEYFNFDAVYIARRSSDFSGLSLLGISPTFYFIKEGKILDKFGGWSNEDGGAYAKKQIGKGLTAIGIKNETGDGSNTAHK